MVNTELEIAWVTFATVFSLRKLVILNENFFLVTSLEVNLTFGGPKCIGKFFAYWKVATIFNLSILAAFVSRLENYLAGLGLVLNLQVEWALFRFSKCELVSSQDLPNIEVDLF